MKNLFGAFAALTLSLCVFANAAGTIEAVSGYRILPEPDTDLSLNIEKTGIWKGKHHSVHFERYQADIAYDATHPVDSKVRLVIDAGSLTCTDTWLEEKYRRRVVDWGENHMLEVQRFPEIEFASRSAVERGPNEYEVTGLLTVHGVTRTEKLTVRVSSRQDGGFQFAGEAYVNMRDFGMEPPSAMMGAIGTKEVMYIHFHLGARPSGLAR